MNKQGVEITLNFIVIAAIVLIALIVAVLFFTGATDKLFTKQAEVTQLSTQELSLAQSICESHCTQQNRIAYENPAFSQQIRDAGYTSCTQILAKDFSDCIAECKGAPNCIGLNKAACQSTAECTWS